jgi:hypothetical protein
MVGSPLSDGSDDMQVSAQNSLTWLQTTPAAVAAADQVSSAYGQVSPSDNASGAESGSSAISALQSPGQMFSSSSLDSLLSAQTDTGSSDSTGSSTAAAPPAHHHHHHHGGGGVDAATSSQDASSTSDATSTTSTATATTSASSDASAQADIEQVLTNV